MIVGFFVSGNRIFYNLYILWEVIFFLVGDYFFGLEGKGLEILIILIVLKVLFGK